MLLLRSLFLTHLKKDGARSRGEGGLDGEQAGGSVDGATRADFALDENTESKEPRCAQSQQGATVSMGTGACTPLHRAARAASLTRDNCSYCRASS